MPKGATAVLAVLMGTGCTSQLARTPLQAMLLPPVDDQLALWINKPAYFAVVGIGSGQNAEVLYQQTALEGVPASGYVYVPMRNGDADYEQVYLVASPTPIDLSSVRSGSPGRGSIVERYDVKDTIDLPLCRSSLIDESMERALYPWRDVHLVPPSALECEHRYRRQYGVHREFAVLTAKSTPTNKPTHKSLPPNNKPVQPKPGEPRFTERDLRYLAAKDQWHALTNHGEPGTELAHALDHVQAPPRWAVASAGRSVTSVPRSSASSLSAASSHVSVGSSSASNSAKHH